MDMQPFPHIHAALEPTDPLVAAYGQRTQGSDSLRGVRVMIDRDSDDLSITKS
jgi:hypothetical protein